jgi:hypothetical protein
MSFKEGGGIIQSVLLRDILEIVENDFWDTNLETNRLDLSQWFLNLSRQENCLRPY